MASTTPVNWKLLGRVNSTDATVDGNDQYGSRIIGLANGGFVVVWEDNSNVHSQGLGPSDIVGRRYSFLGNKIVEAGPTGELHISVTYNDFNQQRPALTAMADGGFAAAYQSEPDPLIGDGENIDVSLFNAGGSFDHNEDYRQGTTPPVVTDEVAPAIAAFAGGYVLAYRGIDAGNSDIFYHVSTGPFSFPTPPPTRMDAAVGAGNQIDAQVAVTVNHATNPVFVIAYEDDATGAIKAFRGNVTAGALSTVSLSGAGAHSGADIAALTGGAYVVAWTDANGDGAGNKGIEFRIGTASGGVGAAVHKANTSKTGHQADVAVAALADGGFALVWEDSARGIRGQLFSKTGTKVGVEFSVQANSSGTKYTDPDVAKLSDGRLAVSFTKTTGTNSDVQATIIDPRAGTILGTGASETLTSRPTGATLSGLGGNDKLYGLNGADTLIGGSGNDELRGSLGGDTYVLDNGTDNVIDTGGNDTIRSTTSRSLSGNYAEVENLTLLGTAKTGTGSGLANIITGNNVGNSLVGNGGNDVLIGEGGNDTLTGGAGNDFFVFNRAPSAATRDKIVDMNKSGNDTIRLENAIFKKLTKTGTLSQEFFKLSTASKDANDYIQYNKASGALSYDPDGSGGAAGVVFAILSSKPTLTHADFYVI